MRQCFPKAGMVMVVAPVKLSSENYSVMQVQRMQILGYKCCRVLRPRFLVRAPNSSRTRIGYADISADINRVHSNDRPG